jgi:hypothetical protein
MKIKFHLLDVGAEFYVEPYQEWNVHTKTSDTTARDKYGLLEFINPADDVYLPDSV